MEKSGAQSEYIALGKALLKGKRITQITLRGKTYKFDYSRDESLKKAEESKWDTDFAVEYADEYEEAKEDGFSVQSRFICDLTSDFCLNSGGFGSGKSLALYIKLILFAKCFPGNRILLGRKTLADLERNTLPDLFDLMPPQWYRYKVKNGIIEFKNGSQIVLFGLDAMQSGSQSDIKKAEQKLKSRS